MTGTTNCDVVCWDTETSDTDVRHGQIFDFAAVTSNLTDLVETGTRTVRIRRLSYCIPAYGALSTNRLDPYALEATDRTDEFSAAASIHGILSPKPGRPLVVLGYNILSFDEEIVRTTFFRNLLDPYATSAKGVRRFDLLPAARLAHALDPDAFPAGRDDDGGPSFRLERIAPANGIGLRAHDALEDARATLALARRLRSSVPAAWETCLRASDRYEAERVFDAAAARNEPVWVLAGGNAPVLEPAYPVGKNGRLLVLARSSRLAESMQIGADALDLDDWRDGSFIRCRTNRMPVVLSAAAAAVLSELHPGAFPVPPGDVRAPGAGWSEFKRALASRVADADPWTKPTGPTAEERIYDGFVDWGEKDRMRHFRYLGTWEERAAAFAGFRDSRIREFAARAIVEHGGLTHADLTAAAGEAAADEIAELAGAAIERPFAGYDARWMTLARGRLEGEGDERYRNWLEDVATPEAATPPPIVPVEADRRGQYGWSF